MQEFAWHINILDVPSYFHMKMKVSASQEQAKKYSSFTSAV
jgi:hypothetical protein